MKRMVTLLLVLLLGAVILVACGSSSGQTAVATQPAPTLPASAETAVVAQPTPVPPTWTPTSTATPLPAPAVIVLEPPTRAADTPTPEPLRAEGILYAGDFTDRNPLTGELVSNTAVLQRRPLVVKLSNAPAIYTRPQSGLNDADWVFEHTTEGSLTRFSAIFYGKTPAKIGPVRSARLIDLELPAMFDAGLVFSGASAGVRQRLYASDFAGRINEAGFGLYRTGQTDRPLEHTLYGNPVQLWAYMDNIGQNRAPQFSTYLSFSETPPEGGTPARRINLNYQGTFVLWEYNAASGLYLRWSDGEVHADGNTLEQVRAANVVVIAPYHAEDPTICEEIVSGVCRHLSVQIQLWGSGTGAVFRDGQRYEVKWYREARNDMLTFTDLEGNPFPLKIGNTWVQLVPTWLQNPLRVEP